MDESSLIMVIALIILVGLSAYFSASETAFSSVNKIRLKNYAKEGNKKAEKALKLAENFDKSVTTILIGNNLVNIAATSLCTLVLLALASPRPNRLKRSARLRMESSWEVRLYRL